MLFPAEGRLSAYLRHSTRHKLHVPEMQRYAVRLLSSFRAWLTNGGW